MMDPKSLRDLDASISILSRNLQAYFGGDPYAYLTVAGELRKLLCDNGRNGDNSLVLRLHPGISFHAIKASSLPIDGPEVVFSLPGLLTLDGRKTGAMGSPFDERSGPMPLAVWREQPLVSLHITIRELIKSVADKEVAHSDPALNGTLATLKSVRFGPGATSDSELVASIGHYVLRNLLVRRVVDLQAELLLHYQRCRNESGPGALKLSVRESQRPYSDGVSIGFINVAEVLARDIRPTAYREQAASLMEQHRDSKTFLLWVDDLQNGIWLNQVGPR
jgi:hypothetical protein